VPLDKLRLARIINYTIGVNPEAILYNISDVVWLGSLETSYHVTKTSGDTKASHSPEKRMKRARLLRKEVPC
jgi:hypothetical protein